MTAIRIPCQKMHGLRTDSASASAAAAARATPPIGRRRSPRLAVPRPPSSSSSTAPRSSPSLLELDLPGLGRLDVSSLRSQDAITHADDAAAAVLITRAFQGTDETVALADARLFVRRLLEVGRAAEKVVVAGDAPHPPPALLLMARLMAEDGAGGHRQGAAEEGWGRREEGGEAEGGKTEGGNGAPAAEAEKEKEEGPRRVAGVACVSFAAGDGSRAELAGIEGVTKPPGGEPYLFNVAVDPRLRRRGVASALVRAAEEAARRQAAAATGGGGSGGGGGGGGGGGTESTRTSMWLHVRQADEAAQALYRRAGYEEVGRDPLAGEEEAANGGGGLFGGWLFGAKAKTPVAVARPRICMRKSL
jgi:ribosomal protein S18 acetylase RimI-like enzyme